MRREAPAAARNREPIAEALAEELPPAGLVLEVASGTGEHAVHLAPHVPSSKRLASRRIPSYSCTNVPAAFSLAHCNAARATIRASIAR